MVFSRNGEGCWRVKTCICAGIKQMCVFGEAEKAEPAAEGCLRARAGQVQTGHGNCPAAAAAAAARAFPGRGDPTLLGETRRDERLVLAACRGISGRRCPVVGGSGCCLPWLSKALCPVLLAQAQGRASVPVTQSWRAKCEWGRPGPVRLP